MRAERTAAEAPPTYRLAATVDIGAPSGEVMRWLVEPELLRRWVIGVESAEWTNGSSPAQGAEVRVTSGSRAGYTLVGVFLELTATSVVKRYVLDSARPADHLAFDRLVRFEFAAAPGVTRLSASVDVVIEGLPRSAIGRSAAVEQRAVERSLDRLRTRVEGRRRPLLARLRDQNQSPQVL